MILKPEQLTRRDRYKVLIGTVLPRPIAWVSTIGSAGTPNVAPFSYFTVAATNPMTLVFFPQIPATGAKKDTLRNIEEVPEFVINITNEETAEAMNLTATTLRHGVSEFEWANLTPAASATIRAPRVAEAPVSFECRLQQIVHIGDGRPGSGTAVFGEVQCIHVRDDIYVEGRIDLEALRPIGRLAGAGYTRVTDLFFMDRVPPPDDA